MYLEETNICKISYQADDTLEQLKNRVGVYPPELKLTICKDLTWMAEFALIHANKAMVSDDTHTFVTCLARCETYIIQVIFALNGVYFISDKDAVERCANFQITVP